MPPDKKGMDMIIVSSEFLSRFAEIQKYVPTRIIGAIIDNPIIKKERRRRSLLPFFFPSSVLKSGQIQNPKVHLIKSDIKFSTIILNKYYSDTNFPFSTLTSPNSRSTSPVESNRRVPVNELKVLSQKNCLTAVGSSPAFVIAYIIFFADS